MFPSTPSFNNGLPIHYPLVIVIANPLIYIIGFLFPQSYNKISFPNLLAFQFQILVFKLSGPFWDSLNYSHQFSNEKISSFPKGPILYIFLLDKPTVQNYLVLDRYHSTLFGDIF